MARGEPVVPMVCRSHASRGSAHLSTLPCLLTPLGQAWYALPLPLPLTLALAPNPNQAWYALSSGASSRGVFAGAPGFAVPIRKCPLDHFLEPASLHPVAAYPPPKAGCPPECPPRPQLPSPTPEPSPGPEPEPEPGPDLAQGNTVREFSFLDNPRAAALKASTASTALVADAGAAGEITRLVASYAQTKVLPHRTIIEGYT